MPVHVIGSVRQEVDLAPGLVARANLLLVRVEPFAYEFNNSRGIYEGSLAEAVTDAQITYFALLEDGTLYKGSDWPGSLHIRLARVVAYNGAVVDIIDDRVLLTAGEHAGASVFGSQFNTHTDNTQEYTTSAEYVQKTRMTTPDLPAGSYRLAWYVKITASAADKKYALKIDRDDAETVVEMPYLTSAVVMGCNCQSGFSHLSLDGVHTFDVDYKRVDNNIEVHIGGVDLELWRVS